MYVNVRLNDRSQGALSFAGLSETRGKPALFNPGVWNPANLDYLTGSQGAGEACLTPDLAIWHPDPGTRNMT